MVSRNLVWSGLLSCAILLLCTAAHAQKALHNDDASIGGFYQFTSSTSGNGITDTTSKSLGGEASFRHSFHPLMGFEIAYDYSRFSEFYTGEPFGYQHNLHVFSGSYYVHGPRALGIQPFAMGGISAVIFSPTLNGGQNTPWQARPGANFGAGINYPLLTSHFGLRLQYRGLYYEAPDFSPNGLPKVSTGTFRLTSEPLAGIYLQF